MSDTEYIITVQREHRAAMPDNWMRAIRELDGVEVLSEDERFHMLRVKASKSALDTIQDRFADWLHIEERSEHETRK